MDVDYAKIMETDDKERLAMTGDMGAEACSVRLMAARMAIDLPQRGAASAAGVKQTTYNNMERGLAFPSRQVMKFYYRQHRIDFNFLMHGDFAQLPADVQLRLFPALASARSEWDRKDNSGPAQAAKPGEQQTT